eukprot:5108845-Pyramimonas_sp.AAC.1
MVLHREARAVGCLVWRLVCEQLRLQAIAHHAAEKLVQHREDGDWAIILGSSGSPFLNRTTNI